MTISRTPLRIAVSAAGLFLASCGQEPSSPSAQAPTGPVRLQNGIAAVTQRLEHPAGSAQQIYGDAKLFFDRREYDRAQPGFAAVALKFPTDPMAFPALHYLGLSQLLAGDTDGAYEAFQEQVTRYPSGDAEATCEALFQIGAIEWNRGHKIEARQTWQKIIAAYPESRWAAWSRDRIVLPDTAPCCA